MLHLLKNAVHDWWISATVSMVDVSQVDRLGFAVGVWCYCRWWNSLWFVKMLWKVIDATVDDCCLPIWRIRGLCVTVLQLVSRILVSLVILCSRDGSPVLLGRWFRLAAWSRWVLQKYRGRSYWIAYFRYCAFLSATFHAWPSLGLCRTMSCVSVSQSAPVFLTKLLRDMSGGLDRIMLRSIVVLANSVVHPCR